MSRTGPTSWNACDRARIRFPTLKSASDPPPRACSATWRYGASSASIGMQNGGPRCSRKRAGSYRAKSASPGKSWCSAALVNGPPAGSVPNPLPDGASGSNLCSNRGAKYGLGPCRSSSEFARANDLAADQMEDERRFGPQRPHGDLLPGYCHKPEVRLVSALDGSG